MKMLNHKKTRSISANITDGEIFEGFFVVVFPCYTNLDMSFLVTICDWIRESNYNKMDIYRTYADGQMSLRILKNVFRAAASLTAHWQWWQWHKAEDTAGSSYTVLMTKTHLLSEGLWAAFMSRWVQGSSAGTGIKLHSHPTELWNVLKCNKPSPLSVCV